MTEAKGLSGRADNIRMTVASAECYLNYDKLSFEPVLSNFDSRFISAFIFLLQKFIPLSAVIYIKRSFYYE